MERFLIFFYTIFFITFVTQEIAYNRIDRTVFR